MFDNLLKRLTQWLLGVDSEDIDFIWSKREGGVRGLLSRLGRHWWSLIHGPSGGNISAQSRTDIGVMIIAPDALHPLFVERLRRKHS